MTISEKNKKGEHMDKSTRSFGAVFCAFLIGYYYFTNFIMGQFLLTTVGLKSTYFLIIFSAVFPLFFLLFAKKFEIIRSRLKKVPNVSIIVKLLVTLYLIISSLLLIYYNTSFITTFYYDSWELFIITILLIAPALFATKNALKVGFRLSIVVLGILIIQNLIYLLNPSTIYLFAYKPTVPETSLEILMTVLVIIPLLFEPLLFYFLCDIPSSAIQIKKIIGLCIPIILIGCYSNLRLVGEFGNMITEIPYPYFTSWRSIQFNEYTQNLDYTTIIYWIVGTQARLITSAIIFSRVWNLKQAVVSSVLLVVSAGLALYLLYNVNLYNSINLTLMIISASLLLAIAIYICIKSFMIKRTTNG